MNITLHIEASNPAELQEAIAGLAGITGSTIVPQPEPEKQKKNSRGTPKSEKQPDPEQVTGSDTQEETANETSDEIKEEIPTVVELRAKAQEKGKTAEGKKAIKALLDEFGAKSISDVEENDRIGFMRRLEEL